MSEIMDEVIRSIKIMQTRLEIAKFGEKKPLSRADFSICLTGVHCILSGSKPVGLAPTDHPDMEKLRMHLEHKTRGGHDKKSIVDYLAKTRHYGCGRKYFDFWSFWNNRPNFKIEDMKEENRKRFEELKDFCKPFEEIIGLKGFIAWDVAESIQIVREAFLCGYIDEVLAGEIAADFTNMALHTYDDWTDFALSYVCGGCYFIYESCGKEEEVKKMCDKILGAFEELFFSDHNDIWAKYAWFVPKNYFNGFKPEKDLADKKLGCFVTDRISMEGAPIQYAERQPANPKYPDSGWKFMAGDETTSYLADRNNIAVFTLNYMANYDESLLSILDAPVGSVYVRNEQGDFVLREKELKN